MFKIKIIFSIIIFSTLLILTSIIKTQTRIIEKKIYKTEKNIELIKKDLHETQLDFFYLTSPKNLNEKVKQLRIVDYSPMDFSRIYFNQLDFINMHKKITNVKNYNEKK